MKRAGFTMIELIFVIVILGILAAVAIPKLSEVKGDAQLATAAQSYCSDAVKSKLGVIKELKSGGIAGTSIASIVPLGGDWVERSGGIQEGTTGPTLSNTTDNAYVFYTEGNSSVGIGCFVANSNSGLSTAENNNSAKSNIIYR